MQAHLLLQQSLRQRRDQLALGAQQRKRALVRGVHDLAHLRKKNCRALCMACTCSLPAYDKTMHALAHSSANMRMHAAFTTLRLATLTAAGLIVQG